mgnify:CR=1 FL=1
MTKLKDLRSQGIVLALVTALALGADGSGCFGTATGRWPCSTA